MPSYLKTSLKRLQNAPIKDGIIDRLAVEAGVSLKTFIQSFRKFIGLTPGKLHHLFLLNRLLPFMTEHDQSKRLTDTAYSLDFFDQAHFIRFFKSYTGIKPSAYLKYYRNGKVSQTVLNSIEV